MTYKYTAVISSNNSYGECIATNSTSAMSVAKVYGRAESGESVAVYKRLRSGEIRYLSRVIWDPESRRYVSVTV